MSMSTGIQPMVKPAQAPMPARFVRRRHEPPMRLSLADVPEPVEQCDGSWRVPMWTPERGWEVMDYDVEDEPFVEPVTLAECGDPECLAYHREEFIARMIADTKRRLLAARARRRSAAAGRGSVVAVAQVPA